MINSSQRKNLAIKLILKNKEANGGNNIFSSENSAPIITAISRNY